MNKTLVLALAFCCFSFSLCSQGFVKRQGDQFMLNGKPYRYIGTNYWFGTLLGLEKDPKRGEARLKEELDFLKSNSVTNVRIMVGSEGSGLVNGVRRVQPALQTEKGKFDAKNLEGLDLLLSELNKRDMKAVLFISNNWDWSGGFLQYLNWNGLLPDSILRRKMQWDDMRDIVSKFFTCAGCMEDYRKQLELVLSRINTVSGQKYINEPAIMAWQLANEPRPMRPAAVDAYKEWIRSTTAYIKSVDTNHLVTLGTEGGIGTEGRGNYKDIHNIASVDYLTIHIWPKNWLWFQDTMMHQQMRTVKKRTKKYIRQHMAIARKLNKPMVIEEFGLPRDNQQYATSTSTTGRDDYYNYVLSYLTERKRKMRPLMGINFWAFGGIARPIPGQIFWKPGDNYMGDPPMEEQGLNSVFDVDISTWEVIRKHAGRLK